MSHLYRVKEFMRRAGQALPFAPCIPDLEIRKLRAKIILEEALETVAGLGLTAVATNNEAAVHVTKDTLKFDESGTEPDLKEVLDGCLDVNVVSNGTLLACGFSLEAITEAQHEVDESNLRKFSAGGYRSDGTDGNPKGKWIKPKDWTPPNLEPFLIPPDS